MSDHQTVIARFIETATTGDANGFLSNLAAIDWTGAWLDIFCAIIPAGTIHPSIPPVFRQAWRGAEGHGVLSEAKGWSLTRDLASDLDLMASALKLLLPPPEPGLQPLVMFRGQSLADHHAGRHGVWWTPDPVWAELYARSFGRPYQGLGAVIAAFIPEDAIIATLCSVEFVIDPRLITDAFLVREVPAYTLADTAHVAYGDTYRPFRTSLLMGIPSGYDTPGLDEWLGLGCPIEGLASCCEKR